MQISIILQAITAGFILIISSALTSASEWRGMKVSGRVVSGGYDIWGQETDYSLLIRLSNVSKHTVTIKMDELYNAILNVSFIDIKTGEEVEAKHGNTGDFKPRENFGDRETIKIGPGSVVTVSIGLNDFKPFHASVFKGRHSLFKLDIPEFKVNNKGDISSK